MLHLKRASAGSGKTYELAKTYIKLLISTKDGEKKRRLRSKAELREALPSIMAVTFTNKATAEMKQRIVEKLADLAKAADTPPEEKAKIAYLSDFLKEFVGATELQISDIAAEALRILLLHYSDFRVSTIDSFFQSILHTFAYEANLEDSFNLEIDSSYIATMGLDATLDALASAERGEDETLYWLQTVMNDKSTSNQWNIFQKRGGEKSLYTNLIKKASMLEKEEFKGIRASIEDYFSSLSAPFSKNVQEFDRANLEPWVNLHEGRKKAAVKLESLYTTLGVPSECWASNTASRIRDSKARFNPDKIFTFPHKQLNMEERGFSIMKKHRKNVSLASGDLDRLDEAYREFVDINDALESKKERDSARLRTWKIYRNLLPDLLIVLEIARRKKEYLDSTNTFELSDTNSILSRIIGKDDTPFIYERMGSIINHYLIDEFQDTSRMQWNNFLPLLKESESRYNDNLIIGDAKQSIYRFRNADYRLIRNEVEECFTEVIHSAGDEEKDEKDAASENTNYRSERNIIQFNNQLFSSLTDNSCEQYREVFGSIADVYADCVQHYPATTAGRALGYVEAFLYPPLGTDEKNDSESMGYISLAEPGLSQLPQRILDLRRRGYRFGDIGVLVRTNLQGNAAVQIITDHNNAHPENPIPIISEENLLVGSSLAVRVILHALKLAAQGPQQTIKENPVLREPVDEKALFEMLNSLQAMALTSIVEAVVDNFIPEKLRDNDAPFIAAFQDAVLDYCSSHSSDIGSFLRWWDKKASSLSIQSPEDTDGVKVVTVHKAKGLEYPVVIVPMADFPYFPSEKRKEWKWIRPDVGAVEHADLLPPFIPVETAEILKDTPHQDVWDEFRENVALDALNSMYVAFTRAVEELYILAPLTQNSKSSVTTAGILTKLMSETEFPGDDPLMMQEKPSAVEKEDAPEGSLMFTYGSPLTAEEIEAKRSSGKETAELVIDRYRVNSKRKLLRFKDAELDTDIMVEEEAEADSEDLDPRSEGNLKHHLLELVNVEEDLDKAVRKMLVKGLITARQADLWLPELREKLESVRQYGWFAGGNRILSERTILQFRSDDRRPDRIIVTPEGRTIVVDYKFGKPHSEHKTQVQRYMEGLAGSGMFADVEGYLWYVNENSVIEVRPR